MRPTYYVLRARLVVTRTRHLRQHEQTHLHDLDEEVGSVFFANDRLGVQQERDEQMGHEEPDEALPNQLPGR